MDWAILGFSLKFSLDINCQKLWFRQFKSQSIIGFCWRLSMTEGMYAKPMGVKKKGGGKTEDDNDYNLCLISLYNN